MAEKKSADSCKSLVVIGDDDVEYSLLKGPDEESMYVKEAHKILSENLQIKELASDLTNVGKLILIAYCGVMGHLELEMKVRDRLHSVVKLCDDTVHTLNEFNRASNNAIANMATAYDYLVDGFEDIALETLQDVAKISKAMEKKSKELKDRFSAEAAEVKSVHDHTRTKKEKVTVANKKTEDTMKVLETDKSVADKELKKVTQQEKETEKKLNSTLEEEMKTAEEMRKIAANLAKEIDEIQLESDKITEQEMKKPQYGIFSRIKNGITHLTGGETDEEAEANMIEVSKRMLEDKQSKAQIKAKELQEAEDKKAQVLKEQRKIHVKILKERAKQREEALKAMTEAAKKLQQLRFEDDIQTESLSCLHHALTALKHLQDIMTLAANFWRETHSFCDELSGEKITKQVNRLLATPEEKRQRLWNAHPFKMDAIRYYSNWVAVRKVCNDSRASITSSQRQVHLFIRENPTKREAVGMLQILANEFKPKMGSDQQQITYVSSDEEENY